MNRRPRVLFPLAAAVLAATACATPEKTFQTAIEKFALDVSKRVDRIVREEFLKCRDVELVVVARAFVRKDGASLPELELQVLTAVRALTSEECAQVVLEVRRQMSAPDARVDVYTRPEHVFCTEEDAHLKRTCAPCGEAIGAGDEVVREVEPRTGYAHARCAYGAIELELTCPKCGTPHFDEGRWIPHNTHECAFCFEKWQPHDYATRGVRKK